MCRQAWFKPGESARDVGKLTAFFAALEKSCGGHGNGAGFVDMKSGAYDTEKGEKMSVEECAKLVAERPATAWGIFHTRLASAGGRSDAGCHPHCYETQQKDKSARRLVVLTHNGTWPGWHGACVALRAKYPSDSATIAALISLFGFGKIASEVDETIIAAIREGGKWRIRAWRDLYPLVVLANGGIASEGGDGEFKATDALRRGGHSLTGKSGVRTEPLAVYVPLPRGTDGRFAPRECGMGFRYGGGTVPTSPPATKDGDAVEALATGQGSVFEAMADAEWEAYLARESERDLTRDTPPGEGDEDVVPVTEECAGEYVWRMDARGVLRRVRKGTAKDDPSLFLPGYVKVDPRH